MLVTSHPNLRYLTGFTGSNGVAVVSPSDTWFFTDPRYQFQAAREVSAKARAVKGQLLEQVAKLAARHQWRRIAFEPDHVTAAQMELLLSRAGKGLKLIGRGGEVEKLRMLKSEEELAAIERSVETNSRALDAALKLFKPGMTESELAAEIEYQMRKLGAEKPSFDTIVASGERSALPHAHPTAARIEAGVLLIDMGAFQDGYASDMTRTFFVSEPGRKMRAMYKAVLEAQLAGVDAVRPGVTASAVDRAARNVLKLHGLGKAFMHSTGHGLGLEIHEPPRLGLKDKTRLEAGMAITIEPGAYVHGLGGVRIEDTVQVTAQGHRVLTMTPKELRVI